MRLLVNASNLVIGGGIQVGVWFIRSCIEHKVLACFAVSNVIYQELQALGCDSEHVHLIKHSPARDKSARNDLRELADKLRVDVVFTVFGPAYVQFNQPHVTGFADGWVSHSSWQSFKATFSHNWMAAAKTFLINLYKLWAIRQADLWILETQVAATGLAKRACLPPKRCYVVENNCAQGFYNIPLQAEPNSSVFTLLYLTADYPHKGITLFLNYARELKSKMPQQAFRFVISISPESASAKWILSYAQHEDLAHYFDFCGYVTVSEAVTKVDECHVVMQMSHLETFSANYPEAMARNRALLVSDYSFSRAICGNAARYVNPNDTRQVTDAIIELRNNAELRSELVDNGVRVLAKLPTTEQRFQRYLTIIKTMVKGD